MACASPPPPRLPVPPPALAPWRRGRLAGALPHPLPLPLPSPPLPAPPLSAAALQCLRSATRDRGRGSSRLGWARPRPRPRPAPLPPLPPSAADSGVHPRPPFSQQLLPPPPTPPPCAPLPTTPVRDSAGRWARGTAVGYVGEGTALARRPPNNGTPSTHWRRPGCLRRPCRPMSGARRPPTTRPAPTTHPPAPPSPFPSPITSLGQPHGGLSLTRQQRPLSPSPTVVPSAAGQEHPAIAHLYRNRAPPPPPPVTGGGGRGLGIGRMGARVALSPPPRP